MRIDKVFKPLLWIQGLYLLFTALWALIDIDSFMQLTGPKTDIWLVKTVSVLLLAIGLGFIVQAFVNTNPLPVILVALISSTGLAAIDIYYHLRGVISIVYFYDGWIELAFALLWTYVLFRFKFKSKTRKQKRRSNEGLF